MKKILTFLFCVFSLLTISSCQIVSVGSLDDSVEDVSDDNSEIIDDTNDESDIIALKEEYEALKAQKEALENEIASLNEKYNTINSSIEDIGNQISENNNDVLETNSLIKTIENEVLMGSVIIIHYSYVTNSSLQEEVYSSLGSGFIIKESESYYYLLTNNHVITGQDGQTREELFVYDYNLNKYTGTVISYSEAYDMAIISIIKNEKYDSLKIMTLNDSDPIESDTVIAIGQPNGQVNSVTIGVLNKYILISNVDYKVIYHSAWTDHGNSGGMLLNTDLKVIGINTWGGLDNSYENHLSYASPVLKIKEFLEIYSFSL